MQLTDCFVGLCHGPLPGTLWWRLQQHRHLLQHGEFVVNQNFNNQVLTRRRRNVSACQGQALPAMEVAPTAKAGTTQATAIGDSITAMATTMGMLQCMADMATDYM